VFATIPGGTFQMGDSHGDGIENELPVHEVDVSSFMIQQAEVTNGQFASVMYWAIQNWPRSIEIYSDGSSLMYDSLHLVSLQSTFNELYILEREVRADSGKEDYPCLSMTWYGAMVYCHILTQIAGDLTQAVDLSNWTIDLTATGFRPPTEAEWEKAARGGLVGMRFPWGNVIDHSYANYAAWGTQYTYDQSPYEVMRYHPDWDGGELPYTNPAGAIPPNGFGLYDLAGNGAEWCYDYYSPDTYATSGSLNPTGPASGTRRILRGGTFWAPAPACRVSYRMSLDPTEVGGFRPARSLEAASP
jgi:formylglycine-generating enzyme required for sulfatase activity